MSKFENSIERHTPKREYVITSTPKHIQCFQKCTIKGDELNIETLGCQLHTQVIYNRKINKLISIIDLKKKSRWEGDKGDNC